MWMIFASRHELPGLATRFRQRLLYPIDVREMRLLPQAVWKLSKNILWQDYMAFSGLLILLQIPSLRFSPLSSDLKRCRISEDLE